MDSNNLTNRQRDQLHKRVTRQLDYLERLKTRMNQLAFPADDPILLEVAKAHAAVFNLQIQCHRLCVAPRKDERGAWVKKVQG